MTLDLGKDYVDITPKVHSKKKQKDILSFIKTKNVCPLRDIIKKIKRQTTGEWKYLQIIHMIKELYAEYKKNPKNSIIRNQRT